MQEFDAHLDAHQERFVAELGALLRVPSVAAQGHGIAEWAAALRLLRCVACRAACMDDFIV